MIDLRDMPNAGRYQLIYADPAWRFRTHGPEAQNGKGAGQHYATSAVEEFGRLPVSEVAAPACWLCMWTTWPHLQEAFELARLWSDPTHPWTYRTGGAWAKRPRNWRGDPDKWQFGTGYILRSACEVVLIFGRGYATWRGTAERNLWVAPIRAHSEKPDEVRAMLERATDGPRLELFARGPLRPNWDQWGYEAGRDVL